MQQQQLPNNVSIRSGIIFGPGRSTRLPDPGTPEYKQLIDRMRNVAQNNK